MEKNKLIDSSYDIILILMMIVYLVNNYYVEQGKWQYIFLYLVTLFFVLFSKGIEGWISKVLWIFKYGYIFYAICTIYFYLDGNFYLTHVIRLFPDNIDKLLIFYNNGWAAGLTNHYSTNAIFLACGTMLIFTKLLCDNRNKFDIILLLISVVALLLTAKRAHIIFVIMSIFLLYYLYSSNRPKDRVIKVIFVIILSIFIGIILVYLFPTLGSFVNRFYETINDGNITQDRDKYWAIALELFKENKLIGIGWNQFLPSSTSYITYLSVGVNVHNVYIQLLTESGIIGFAIYMLWFLLVYRLSIRQYLNIIKLNMKCSKSSLFYLSYSICIQTFFLLYCTTGNPLYDREIFIPYFISCAITLYYYKNGDKNKSINAI